MMAPSDVHSEATHVRVDLQTNGAEAFNHVRDFVERFAVTRELTHRVLLLERNVLRSSNEQWPQLRQEVVTLINEVVSDWELHGDSEEARTRHAALERARRLVQLNEPAREVASTCEGIGKTYRKTSFTLRDVTFSLRLGEIMGVVGRNGNGKTTLFRILAGELQHDHGRLWFPAVDQHPDDDIDWVAVKQVLAYVPQELPRWHGSLRNNLHYEAALHGLHGAGNEEEVEYLLHRLGLVEHVEKRWSQLSGGFKLRFALARALVSKPRILLLDEPLANLDYITQQVVLRDIRDLASSYRHPIAVLISSQHLHEIEAVADNILFLKRGDVVYCGPASAIGKDRDSNTFELGVSCDIERLRGVLQGPSYRKIEDNGVSYVVRTSLEVTAERLLRTLLEAGLSVEYFRDISRSTKSLFDSEEED